MSLIVYSIPIFFILIGVELLVTKMKKLSYYRWHDSVTNLSLGVTSQIAGIFLKALTFVGYLFLYEHSLWKIDGETLAGAINIATPAGKAACSVIVGLALFTGVDFFYYWFHRLAHEISFLWGSHVVHHQSEEYNLTVALRQAALQGAFSWVFYLPLAVVGFSPAMFLTIASLQTLYQFWIHTKLINRMHPAIEYVFNTPSHHRVHHGVNPKYIDRNHGGTLIIFDRMFGTFQAEEEEVVYGITKQPKSWNPVWLNFEYWIDLLKDVFSVRNWSNGIRMLVKMPGWKPDELGGVEQPREVTVQTFEKYHTEIPAGLNRYVSVQFVFVLLATTAFLNLEMKQPFADHVALKIATATLIIVALVTIGGIFEKKSWVPLLEYLKLAAIPVLVYLLLQKSALVLPVTIGVAAFAGISFIWFSRFLPEFRVKAVNTSADYAST